METYKKLYHVHRYEDHNPELEKDRNLKDDNTLWYTIYRNMGWNKIEKWSRDGYIEYILNIPKECFTSEVRDDDTNKDKILVLTKDNISDYSELYRKTNPRTEDTELRKNYAGVDAHGTWKDLSDDDPFFKNESVDLVNKGAPSGVIWRFTGLYDKGMKVESADTEIPSTTKPTTDDYNNSLELLESNKNKDKHYLLSEDGKRSKNKRKKKIKFRGSIRKKTKKRSYKKKLSRSS